MTGDQPGQLGAAVSVWVDVVCIAIRSPTSRFAGIEQLGIGRGGSKDPAELHLVQDFRAHGDIDNQDAALKAMRHFGEPGDQSGAEFRIDMEDGMGCPPWPPARRATEEVAA